MSNERYSAVINAANIHQGGALQVAVSVLAELADRRPWEDAGEVRPRVVASTEVLHSLQRISPTALNAYKSVELIDVMGLDPFGAIALRRHTRNVDVCLTLFGPLYFPTGAKRNIVGFAQAWIAFPETQLTINRKWRDRIRTSLQFFIQKECFRRSDDLVVETQLIKDRLENMQLAPPSRIFVIPNCIAAIFLRAEKPEATLELHRPDGYDIVLGFLGRGYAHKNLQIIPRIISILADTFGIQAAVMVSLTAEEMQSNGLDRDSRIYSTGPLALDDCPAFYEKIDGLLFPSLLECFSSTPLEALAMRRPVFASDRPFVRQCCGRFATYFDPLDPYTAAEAIANWHASGGTPEAELEEAANFVIALPNAKQRAVDYWQLLLNATAAEGSIAEQ